MNMNDGSTAIVSHLQNNVKFINFDQFSSFDHLFILLLCFIRSYLWPMWEIQGYEIHYFTISFNHLIQKSHSKISFNHLISTIS